MKKRILFVCMKYPYEKPELGKSYEYYNFYDSLLQIKELEVREFDWIGKKKKLGKEKMNELLIKEVDAYKPDLVFFSIFREEFDKNVISDLSKKTITFNWFCDDLWRFDNYVKYWAPCFSWIATVSESVVPRYKKIGYKNVIFSQFASNPRIYKKLSLPKKFSVSFVGQTHSNRKRMIKELERKGVSVNTWGNGWKNGVVDFNGMIRIFNQTKINLNFTATSFSFTYGRLLPWFLQPKFISEEKASLINGRIFEIPSCGGFLLTGDTPNLSSYYIKGKEIVIYNTFEDLVEKIGYYLKNEKEREKIALAGYKRTIKEHTFKRRFLEIFKTIGLL